MGRIFVSYRVADTEWPAARIRDALVDEFGEANVFYDGESLHRGDNWKERIDATLAESEAMVLVVGPTWVDELEKRAKARTPDVHRQEVVAALRRKMPIFVTLVDGAEPLDAERLPRNLKRLGQLEAQPLPRKGFARHVPLLIEDILGLIRGVRPDGGGDADEPRVVTVAEHGDADHLGIAEAIAAVPPGSTVYVRPGHYVDPVVIDRQVQLVGQPDGDQEVVLEVAESPALSIDADRARVSGLSVVCTAERDAVCIEVTGGRPIVEECAVSARDHEGSIGISVRGPDADPVVRGCRATGVETGVRASDGATGRFDDLAIDATAVGVVVSGAADPVVHGGTVRGGARGVVVQDRGRGTLEALRVVGCRDSGIFVEDGAAPVVRRCEVAEPGIAAVAVWDAGGTYEDVVVSGPADKGFLVTDGADPAVRRARVTGAVVAIAVTDGGRGHFSDCEVVASTANGVGVGRESEPVFEGLVVRQAAKHAVYVTGGARPTFRRSTLAGATLAAIGVDGGAEPAFEGADVRCTVHHGLLVTSAGGVYDDVAVASANDNAVAGIGVTSGADPTLRRFVVRGGKKQGVVVNGASRGTFEDGEVTGCGGEAFHVGGKADPRVRRVHLHHVRDDGLWIAGGATGTYEDCEIDHTAGSGIRVGEDCGPVVLRAHIHDIAPKGVAGGFLAGVRGANGVRVAALSGRSRFEDCVIERTRHQGVDLSGDFLPRFERCTVDGAPWSVPRS